MTDTSTRTDVRREVAGYLTGVYGVSIAIAFAMPHGDLAPMLSAFVPVVILAGLTPVFGRSIWRGLGLGRSGLRYWPVAIGIPTLAAALCYAVAFGLGAAQPLSQVQLGIVGVLINLAVTVVFVLTEEVGWRGFLLPRVQRLTSPRNAAVATGFGHALVHLPLVLLTTTYNSAGSRWLVAPLMVVTITAAGICYAWLRDASRSLWPAVIAHSTANTLFFLAASTEIPGSSVQFAYIAGEGGVATASVLTVIALTVVWLVRTRVWQPTSTERCSPGTESDGNPPHRADLTAAGR